jgi:hypothetical protein
MSYKPPPEAIAAWVTRFFPDCKVRKNGEELDIANPYGDTGRHLGINTKKAVCHDWRPGCTEANGSFIRFVMKFRDLPWAGAIREICGQGVDVRRILHANATVEEREEIKAIDLPAGSIPFAEGGGGPLRSIALNYLRSRGVSEDLAIQKRLHFSASEIVFPYFEYEALVYWQARSILNKRFRFPPAPKTDFIYGFDDVEPCSDIILVESIFNAFSIGANAVATGGAALGEGSTEVAASGCLQVRKIRALDPQRVILAPDNDDAGRKSLAANFFLLLPYFEGRIWFSLPPAVPMRSAQDRRAKDWNEVGQALGWDRVRQAYEAGLRSLDQSVLMQESMA